MRLSAQDTKIQCSFMLKRKKKTKQTKNTKGLP